MLTLEMFAENQGMTINESQYKKNQQIIIAVLKWLKQSALSDFTC